MTFGSGAIIRSLRPARRWLRRFHRADRRVSATSAIRARRPTLESAHLTTEEKERLFKARSSCERNRPRIGITFSLQRARSADPRLRALCEAFLNEWGDRFQRSAAARNYHHARRGGLVEHTAQMMRLTEKDRAALSGVEFRFIAGRNFVSRFRQALGEPFAGYRIHDAVRRTRRIDRAHLHRSRSDQFALEKTANERSDGGGERFFARVRRRANASPASHRFASRRNAIWLARCPKTPEAIALHYIDNLDARLEMFFAGYDTAKPTGGTDLRSGKAAAG